MSVIPRWVSQSLIGIGIVVSLTAAFGASGATQKAPAEDAATVPAQKGVCPAGHSGSAEKGCVDVDECAA